MAIFSFAEAHDRKIKLANPGRDCSWSRSQILSHLESAPFAGLTRHNQWAALILYRRFDRCLEVNFLLTFPEYRRQGLMARLMGELIAKHPLCTFWLEVHAKNLKAQRLYQKLGFKNNGLRQAYYSDGGDGLLFERPPEIAGAS